MYRVVASQLAARFPFGMLSIILLLHVQLAFGDYTSAGIVLATQSAGQAISGPVSSRLMGRWGMRPVLTFTAIACSGLLITIALVHLPLLIVAGIAFFIGITTPPVTPAVRTLYPKLVSGHQLSALFSLDAAAQELIWVIGPVVAVVVTSQFGTAVGLCVAASFMLLGGAWFITSPSLGTVKIPRSRHGLGAVLKRPTVLIATTIGFFFVAAFAAIEAAIVAAFTPAGQSAGHGSIESGVVLALFAGGSLVGGLLIGHRPLRPWSLLVRHQHRAHRHRAVSREPQHLVAQRHAVFGRDRHSASLRRGVEHDQLNGQVFGDRRGIRLDRHGPTGRRCDRLCVRRNCHRRGRGSGCDPRLCGIARDLRAHRRKHHPLGARSQGPQH